eukprot:2521530-Amphidinium_carterae.2
MGAKCKKYMSNTKAGIMLSLGDVAYRYDIVVEWPWFFQCALEFKVLGWVAQRDSAKWTDDYAWAMYWSVANFTPGTSGIQPGTTEEVQRDSFRLI